jgi:hypothetical protein
MEVWRIRRVTIAKWLLHWETWVPWHVGLIGIHGRERSRIHLVHSSLRWDTLLDTERAEVVERVLKHSTLSP